MGKPCILFGWIKTAIKGKFQILMDKPYFLVGGKKLYFWKDKIQSLERRTIISGKTKYDICKGNILSLER